MGLRTDTIEYHDGKTCLEGFLAYDDSLGTLLPAVMISHACRGRDDFVCDKARTLAQLGYAAFALDMYGKGVLGNNLEENARLMQPFMDDRSLLQRRMIVALDTVQDLQQVDAERIAAIGFCFGGLCVLDLARTGADLRGVVSFHGLLTPLGNTQETRIEAKVLMLHGHDDPLVPVDDVLAVQQEMTEAGADWQFLSYGHTMHAFTNPMANDPDFGTVYQPVADRRSWQSMKNFLEEVLAD